MNAERGELRQEAVSRLRADAEAIFRAAVRAADPATAIARAFADPAHGLDGTVARARDVAVVAFGKAACAMAASCGDALVHRGAPWRGVAVTNRENRVDVRGFRVLVGGHPLPDSAGVRAAAEVARFVEPLAADDLLLVLISGGGSAILPSPADGLTLDDKLATTALLLGAGASIGELNTVRKHLSWLKGGGLAAQSGAGRVVALILSDVIGDDLSTIASGPTVGDPTTFADARDVLARRGVLDRVPSAVRERIAAGVRGELPETPKPGDATFARVANILAGSNTQSVDAAIAAARELGYDARVESRALVGEARAAGARFAVKLRDLAEPGAVAILAGGETTVTVRGRGRGGRNQELALAFALALDEVAGGPGGRAWAFLSAGTDGIDGPTDAAGAIVDPTTLARGRAHGVDASAALGDNDAYRFLAAAGDLLVTGATGTNVADLQVLLVARGE